MPQPLEAAETDESFPVNRPYGFPIVPIRPFARMVFANQILNIFDHDQSLRHCCRLYWHKDDEKWKP